MESLEEIIFIICPVRELTPEEDYFLQNYISGLENRNCKVHYPPRDTNQNDPVGLNICTENRLAIINSDEVQIYYTSKSKGTPFDLGMTFMAEKPLYIINADLLKYSTQDDFSKFLFKYAYNVRWMDKDVPFYKDLVKRREKIKKSELIEYEWKENILEDKISFIFDFGMAFMAKKPIILKNKNEVKRTPYKSFQNVLIELDKKYRKWRH